jgi:dUTPase
MGLWVIPEDICKIYVQDPIMQKVYHRSGLKMKSRILFGKGI